MRIVHVITRLIRGGADENTLISANCQARDGHDVHLVCGAEANPAMLERVHPSVQVHTIPDLVRPLRPVRDIRAIAGLVQLLNSLKPDIVHTHTSKAGVLGRVAAKMAGTPGIIHGVHILPFLNVGRAEYALYLGAERLLAPITHAFVNVSAGMRDAGIARRVGHPDRHVVIPSGMDVERFRDARPITLTEMAALFSLPVESVPELRLLVMVAALEPRKRVVEFLDVFERLAKADERCVLAVLGEGHDRARIEARIETLGLSGRVALIGFRDDVERWIATARVCVLASDREGLPRAVVQYALAARPIVCTALPGVDVIVKHGETGFLIPPDRMAEMYQPLLKILVDPSLAHSMRVAARAQNMSAWSTEQMIASLERLYRAVLTEKSRNSRNLATATAARDKGYTDFQYSETNAAGSKLPEVNYTAN